MKWVQIKDRYINCEKVLSVLFRADSKNWYMQFTLEGEEWYKYRVKEEEREALIEDWERFLMDDSWHLINLSRFLEEV